MRNLKLEEANKNRISKLRYPHYCGRKGGHGINNADDIMFGANNQSIIKENKKFLTVDDGVIAYCDERSKEIMGYDRVTGKTLPDKFCRNCGMKLPEHIGMVPNYNAAFYGKKGAGKTCLLSGMELFLESFSGFTAASRESIRVVREVTTDDYENIHKNVKNNFINNSITPTPITDEEFFLNLNITNNNFHAGVSLSMYDLYGEISRMAADKSSSLYRADVIFLLIPATDLINKDLLDEDIRAIRNLMAGLSKDTYPSIYFIVSKADKLSSFSKMKDYNTMKRVDNGFVSVHMDGYDERAAMPIQNYAKEILKQYGLYALLTNDYAIPERMIHTFATSTYNSAGEVELAFVDTLTLHLLAEMGMYPYKEG